MPVGAMTGMRSDGEGVGKTEFTCKEVNFRKQTEQCIMVEIAPLPAH